MKPKHLIPPVAALIISAVFLGSQYRRVSKLESETMLLNQATAKQAESVTQDSVSEASKKTEKAVVKVTGPLDWRKIAALLEVGDRNAYEDFFERLRAMTRDELIAALDEIAALGLSEEARTGLERSIISYLGKKDPAYVLARFVDGIQGNDSSMSYSLAEAFKNWVAQDLGKATAWFDAQIAAGKFDSKTLDGESTAKARFETALLGKLLGADFAAAEARFSNMTEKQRETVLRIILASKLDAAGQVDLAKLIRTQIPEAERLSALSYKADDFVSTKEGFTKVTEFLDLIQATPEERAAAAKSSAESHFFELSRNRKPTREDIESMRTWVAGQSPQSTNAVTGQALNDTLGGDFAWSFADAAKLVLEYNQAAGNDEVLKTFLEGYHAGKHKDEARALAAKITDAAVRNSVLENLD